MGGRAPLRRRALRSAVRSSSETSSQDPSLSGSCIKMHNCETTCLLQRLSALTKNLLCALSQIWTCKAPAGDMHDKIDWFELVRRIGIPGSVIGWAWQL